MPRWKVSIAFVAAALVIAVTIGLGNWQTRRAAEKATRQAAWDAMLVSAPVSLDGVPAARQIAMRLPQRVRVEGRFVPEATVYVGNRLLDGAPGQYVVTPLALSDGYWILVNRGWSPYAQRGDPRLPAPLQATVVVTGVAVERVPRVLELGETELRLGGVWQNLDFAAYERASGRRVAQFVVQQTNDTGDGLQRRWMRPDTGVDKHRGYAFQWYGLAALTVALTGFFGWRALRGQ
jgi:cytochrome oxidase assembly protein ShyY1